MNRTIHNITLPASMKGFTTRGRLYFGNNYPLCTILAGGTDEEDHR